MVIAQKSVHLIVLFEKKKIVRKLITVSHHSIIVVGGTYVHPERTFGGRFAVSPKPAWSRSFQGKEEHRLRKVGPGSDDAKEVGQAVCNRNQLRKLKSNGEIAEFAFDQI